MITKEQAQAMSLSDIKSLRTDDFVLREPGATWSEEEAYKALVARFNELDPEFETFLEHVRPDLLSQYGSPGVFLARVEKMSPFELVRTYCVLTSGGLEDIEFCRLVHRLMGLQVARAFSNEQS